MDLKTHVRSVVNCMTCAIHHQKPLLAIAEGDIRLECCCDDFKVLCFNRILQVMLDYKDQKQSVSWG